MPIHLYTEKDRVSIKGLEGDDWDLPTQLEKLEKWVRANQHMMTDGPYIADIGFMIQDDAGGGGAVFSYDAMGIMAKIKLSIYFSENVGHDE